MIRVVVLTKCGDERYSKKVCCAASKRKLTSAFTPEIHSPSRAKSAEPREKQSSGLFAVWRGTRGPHSSCNDSIQDVHVKFSLSRV